MTKLFATGVLMAALCHAGDTKTTGISPHSLVKPLSKNPRKTAAVSSAPRVESAGSFSASGRVFPAFALSKDWPTFNGDYSGRRYSALSQINQSNVRHLTLAWMSQIQTTGIKSTPLMVDGVLYFSTPDNVWAADAASGATIWHYHRESQGDHIGNRGVGMYGDWLYFATPDCHLVSLEAKTGKLRWDVELADPKAGYFSTMAPLIIRDHVIVGVSGDVTDIPGFLASVDPASGTLQWKWNTEPKAGEPGSETWPQGTDAITHGGGMTWMTGTYDSELNQLYWGIGNPNPVLNGDIRKGDNLYTCSIVSLNPDTGKLLWHFQASPHDTHDWDAVQTPVLVDDENNGVHRKLLLQASRNGFFFVLDRTTGEHILTAPYVATNWSKGIDSKGQPIPNPAKEPKPDGVLVSPGSDGATNWMAPAFDPKSQLFFFTARRLWSLFYMTAEGKPEGWAGRDRNLWADSFLVGMDYKTGTVRWKHELGKGEGLAGLLATAGNLVFTADNAQNLLALDPATGKTLWHAHVGTGMLTGPTTYELDGRQYLLTPVGNLLLAWTVAD